MPEDDVRKQIDSLFSPSPAPAEKSAMDVLAAYYNAKLRLLKLCSSFVVIMLIVGGVLSVRVIIWAFSNGF